MHIPRHVYEYTHVHKTTRICCVCNAAGDFYSPGKGNGYEKANTS